MHDADLVCVRLKSLRVMDSQPEFICSNLIMKIHEQYVKPVQS